MSGARGGRMNSTAQCVHTALIGGENFVCVSPAQSAQRNNAWTPRGWERAQQMRTGKLEVHRENIAVIVNTLKRVKSWPDNESIQHHM